MESDEVQLKSATISWIASGLIKVVMNQQTVMDEACAVEQTETIRHMAEGKPVGIMVYWSNFRPDARAIYETADVNTKATAVMVNSEWVRDIGNQCLPMFSRRAPIRLFTEEDDAIVWLRQLVPAHVS